MENPQITHEQDVQQQTLPKLDFYESLGIILWMCSHADYHKTWPMWAADRDLVPPLVHSQYRIYFDENQNPVGCATWAWLSEQKKNNMISGGTMVFADWNSGKHLMFGDYIAPWGHAKSILRDLRANVFPDEKAFSLGRNQDGSVRKLYHWKGKKFEENVLVNHSPSKDSQAG